MTDKRGSDNPDPEATRSLNDVAAKIRLWTGLILFVFVIGHLFNQALGLISLAAMDQARSWSVWLLRNPIGTVVLYGSLILHFVTALWAVFQRRSLRMPRVDLAQIILGLSISPLAVGHIAASRLAHDWFGLHDTYQLIYALVWRINQTLILNQTALVLVVWIHGCIGFYFWIRPKPCYPRVKPLLTFLTAAVPLLALTGFSQAGREVYQLTADRDWLARLLAQANAPGPAARVALDRAAVSMLGTAASLVCLVAVGRFLRPLLSGNGKAVRISYPGGLEAVVPNGFTVLEASRQIGAPHAAACGARGRCTTCRVSIQKGLDKLTPPGAEERTILKQIAAPPNVRLACQLRPTADLSVTPLVPVLPNDRERIGGECIAGREQDIAVLFADLRGFTAIAENKLPYDVVFLLNRYFDAVGQAIHRAGGTANQFTGDGVMALFGMDDGPEEGCRQALVAAHDMVIRLDQLSESMAEDLALPLRVGVGIHTGQAVVGDMGHGIAMYLTAVGDTVHVASRFEELTKTYNCQLVISDRVAQRAGVDASRFPSRELTVRNRRAPITVRTIDDVRSLAPDLGLTA